MTRQSASVIKLGVAYVNICVSMHLKEELAWVIDKWLWVISTVGPRLSKHVCVTSMLKVFR